MLAPVDHSTCAKDSVEGDPQQLTGESTVSKAASTYDPSRRFTYIHHYLQKGKHHPDVSEKYQSGIRKAKDNFVIRGKRLHFVDKDGQRNRLVCKTEEEREAALKHCHNDPATGGHFGYNKTQTKLNESYYWLGMTQNVKNWIAACDQCQRDEKIKTRSPTLHPVKKNELWEMVDIDLLGPFTETENRNRYICTMTDLFSKFVFAQPIQTKDATSVSSVLIEFIYLYGPPKKFLSNQGHEFVNELNAFMFEAFDAKHALISTYHSQTTGQDECTNQIVKNTLIKYCNSAQTDWDDQIRAIVYTINTSKQTTTPSKQKKTKLMPYHILFKRKPNSFITNLFDDDDDEVVPAEMPSVTDDMADYLVEKSEDFDTVT